MTIFTADVQSRLQATADSAIWNSHHNTARWPVRRNPNKKPPEEDYVASFILNALPDIAKAWRPLLQQQQMKLSLTGVFCHNTPKASFHMSGSTKCPELADLLIVRRHEDKNRLVRQVAVLIQAKMSDTGEIKLSQNDPQLFLYNNWPKFELKAVNAPSTKFSVGINAQQALYCGIRTEPPCPSDNNAWAGFCPWALMPPKQRGWVEEPLSFFLVKLLNFDAGRDFYDTGTVGCHWSELINYLLQTTFSLPLRTRDVRLDDPRGMTVNLNRMAYMATEPSFTSAYIPKERIQEILNNNGGDVPSELERQFAEGGEGRVLLIETSHAEG